MTSEFTYRLVPAMGKERLRFFSGVVLAVTKTISGNSEPCVAGFGVVVTAGTRAREWNARFFRREAGILPGWQADSTTNASDTILYCGLFTTLLVAAPKQNCLGDRSNSQTTANVSKTIGRILGFDQ